MRSFDPVAIGRVSLKEPPIMVVSLDPFYARRLLPLEFTNEILESINLNHVACIMDISILDPDRHEFEGLDRLWETEWDIRVPGRFLVRPEHSEP